MSCLLGPSLLSCSHMPQTLFPFQILSADSKQNIGGLHGISDIKILIYDALMYKGKVHTNTFGRQTDPQSSFAETKQEEVLDTENLPQR